MCIQPLIWLSNLMTLEDLVVIITLLDVLDTSSHHAKDVGPYREHRLWVIGLNWGSYYDPTRLGGGLGPSYLRRFIGSSSNTSSTSNIEKVLRSSRINGWEHLLLVTWWSWISFQLGNILTWGTWWSCKTSDYTWGSCCYHNFVGCFGYIKSPRKGRRSLPRTPFMGNRPQLR